MVIDVKTRKMVKSLDHSKYVKMAERFDEWMIAVEQGSHIGNMLTDDELAQAR